VAIATEVSTPDTGNVSASIVNRKRPGDAIAGWGGMLNCERDAVLAAWDGESHLGFTDVVHILTRAGFRA
jgi:hypothetical protein